FFKRGQLIAYSGETGSGFPHLHLEVRDKKYFALNPFKLFQAPFQDKKLPVLKGILLRPRGNAAVNGEVGERYIPFRKTRSGYYASREALVLTGSVDMVLSAYDLSDVGRRVAPYEISVFIDDACYYQLSFDRFERDDNNQLGFVYDLFRSNPGSYFFNLFSQKGFVLERRNESLARLIEGLDYGKHEMRVLVKDNF
ncbi:MAG: M23 family metallopeptidase, partial [bacterium]|nr:M23 family metallopeptidase [bacterium]